ncbi:MAG: ferrous iron transport protein A [Clostridia bacterium]|nr:ferrous iron transport protein A [Clostridia bacterium]
MQILPLNKAISGECYEILSVRLNNNIFRRRIFDLGLIPNTIVKVLQKSPFGDPTAYFIRGTVIALRQDCTKKIIVKKIN